MTRLAPPLCPRNPDISQQSSSHKNLVFVSDFPSIKSPNPSFSRGSCAISCLKENQTAVKGRSDKNEGPCPRTTGPPPHAPAPRRPPGSAQVGAMKTRCPHRPCAELRGPPRQPPTARSRESPDVLFCTSGQPSQAFPLTSRTCRGSEWEGQPRAGHTGHLATRWHHPLHPPSNRWAHAPPQPQQARTFRPRVLPDTLEP